MWHSVSCAAEGTDTCDVNVEPRVPCQTPHIQREPPHFRMPHRTPNKNSGNGDSLLPTGKGRHTNEGYAAVASVITKFRGCLEPLNGVAPDPDSCQKIVLELMKVLAEASENDETAVPKPVRIGSDCV